MNKQCNPKNNLITLFCDLCNFTINVLDKLFNQEQHAYSMTSKELAYLAITFLRALTFPILICKGHLCAIQKVD